MKIPTHTSLSLAGNVAIYEHSNKVRSAFYDKADLSPYSALSQQGGMGNKKQSGKGIIDDVFTVASAVADVTTKKKTNQNGKGLGADIFSALGGLAGGVVGAFGGPIGSAVGGATGAYGARKIGEQLGLGYQYKSQTGARGMWQTSSNALGAVSQNNLVKL